MLARDYPENGGLCSLQDDGRDTTEELLSNLFERRMALPRFVDYLERRQDGVAMGKLCGAGSVVCLAA